MAAKTPSGRKPLKYASLRPEYRRGPLAIALAASLFAELEKSGLQMLVISGISVQQPFYQHIGFQACACSLIYPAQDVR